MFRWADRSRPSFLRFTTDAENMAAAKNIAEIAFLKPIFSRIGLGYTKQRPGIVEALFAVIPRRAAT
jgi:hypothetical protein